MKKNILIVFIVVLSLLLIACSDAIEKEVSGNEEAVETVTEEAIEEKPPTKEVNVSDDFLVKGKVIPDLDMYDLEGNLVQLSDYRDKIIMLNFWATWCTYCVKEMPDLETVNQYEDVVVLAINVREPKQLVSDYLTEGGYTFDVVLDESGDLASKFLITSFPTTFFLNKDGSLLGSVPGMMTLEKMNTIIDDIRTGVIK